MGEYDTKSVTELNQAIITFEHQLEESTNKSTAAATVYNRALGMSIDSDLERLQRALRIEETKPAMDRIRKSAFERASAIADEADRIAQATSKPRFTLTEAEHTAAGARLPVVDYVAQNAPVADVVSEVQSSIALNDRAAMSVWLRVLPSRISATATNSASSGSVADAQAKAARTELSELLREIKARMTDGKFVEVNQRAVALRSAAFALQRGTRPERTTKFAFEGANDVPIPR